jgi:ketoreductase
VNHLWIVCGYFVNIGSREAGGYKEQASPASALHENISSYTDRVPVILQLKEQIALVTGASRGIGFAIARSLALAGATVIGIARSSEGLARLKRETDETGGRCQTYCLDVGNATMWEKCLQDAQASVGPIGILVNNAGIYQTAAVRELTNELWLNTLATNCTPALIASRNLLPGMIDAGRGRIIFISSISGKTGEAFGAAYSASKFAMLGLMQSMALEVARFGVTVNAVCPGWVDTEMAHNQINDEQWCRLNGIDPKDAEEITRLSVPQERLIAPTEVANLVLYLASDYARGITGQAINICGGLSIR